MSDAKVGTTPTKEPPLLRRYIEELQYHISVANNTDFKGTSDDELQRAEKECRALYERGQELIATIFPEELALCQKFFVHKHEPDVYKPNPYDLVNCRVGKVWVLVPAHVELITEVRALKEIFT